MVAPLDLGDGSAGYGGGTARGGAAPPPAGFRRQSASRAGRGRGRPYGDGREERREVCSAAGQAAAPRVLARHAAGAGEGASAEAASGVPAELGVA